MNKLYSLVLLFIAVFTKINSLPCSGAFVCPATPHSVGNGWYIGITWETCNKEHTYICSNPLKYCYDRMPNCINKLGKDCPCMKEGIVYDNCYDYKGNLSLIAASTTSYINPFVSSHCGKKKIPAIVNAYDSNCYVSAYGNVVLRSGMAKRTVNAFTNNDGSLRTVNGRCLVGAGWCPCRRA